MRNPWESMGNPGKHWGNPGESHWSSMLFKVRHLLDARFQLVTPSPRCPSDVSIIAVTSLLPLIDHQLAITCHRPTINQPSIDHSSRIIDHQLAMTCHYKQPKNRTTCHSSGDSQRCRPKAWRAKPRRMCPVRFPGASTELHLPHPPGDSRYVSGRKDKKWANQRSSKNADVHQTQLQAKTFAAKQRTKRNPCWCSKNRNIKSLLLRFGHWNLPVLKEQCKNDASQWKATWKMPHKL